jgi:hypothetical protein
MPQAIMPQAVMPQIAPPQSLTQGIPDPNQIASQKANFAAALDKQLKDAMATIQKETEIEKQMVDFNAKKQIDLYFMQVDEKLTEMLALADEQATVTTLELNKAQSLNFDYTMRATQQEWATKRAQFEQQYLTQENKLAQDYAKTLGAAGPAAQGLGGFGYAAPTYAAAPVTTAAPDSYAAPVARAAAPVTYAAAPRTTAVAGYGGYGAYGGAVV